MCCCVAGLFDMEGMVDSNTMPGQAPYHSDDEDDSDGECRHNIEMQ